MYVFSNVLKSVQHDQLWFFVHFYFSHAVLFTQFPIFLVTCYCYMHRRGHESHVVLNPQT